MHTLRGRHRSTCILKLQWCCSLWRVSSIRRHHRRVWCIWAWSLL